MVKYIVGVCGAVLICIGASIVLIAHELGEYPSFSDITVSEGRIYE